MATVGSSGKKLSLAMRGKKQEHLTEGVVAPLPRDSYDIMSLVNGTLEIVQREREREREQSSVDV